MKIKWGALVVDGRNKIGGQVASKNRSGAYMRNKVTPVNPQSSFQVAVRARLASISAAWRALTVAQRAAWNAAVADYRTTDIFGDIQNPSGFSLHQKLNSNLVNIGEAMLTEPPLPVAVPVFDTLSAAFANGAQTAVLTVTPAALPSGSVLIIRATPAISAGRSFVKSEFRQISVVTSVVAGSVNIATAYIAKFGAIGAPGSKIFVECVHVSTNTGQQSQPQQASAIIAA